MRIGEMFENVRKTLSARLQPGSHERRQKDQLEKIERSVARRLKKFEGSLKQHQRNIEKQLKVQERLMSSRALGSRGLQEEFINFARHFSPKSVVGYNKIRVGKANDGGYIMVEDFEGVEIAFSFGVENDASWDLDVARRGIRTLQFDYSIASGPEEHPNIEFFSRKIVATPDDDGETIGGLLSRFGGGPNNQRILKIDIEGDEWPVFESVVSEDIGCFRQIVCEFHDFSMASQPAWLDRAMNVMEKLQEHFQIVHIHGNNYAPFFCIGNVPFPDVLEVTFANRARYKFADCDEIFPTTLDQPNLTQNADLFLGRFQF